MNCKHMPPGRTTATKASAFRLVTGWGLPILLMLFCGVADGADLTYLGKYPLPAGTRFSASAGPICWRPSVSRLILRGHPVNDPATVAELTLGDVGQVPQQVGDWYDISAGVVATMAAQTRVSGIDCTDDDWCMLGTSNWYNVSGASKPVFILRDLRTGQVGGPWFTPYNSNANGGYVSVASSEMASRHGVRWLSGNYVAQGSQATNWGCSMYLLPQPGITLAANSTLPATSVITHPISSPMTGWHQTCHVYSQHDLDGCKLWVGRETFAADRRWYGESTLIEDGVTYKDVGVPGGKGYKAGMRVVEGQPTPSAYKACVWILPHSATSAPWAFQKINLPEIQHLGAVINGAVDRAGNRLFVLDAGKGIHVYGVN